jgi:hypothetical protein
MVMEQRFHVSNYAAVFRERINGTAKNARQFAITAKHEFFSLTDWQHEDASYASAHQRQ